MFYVSSLSSDSWVVVGAESSYSAGGPSRHHKGVRQAWSFQPSCKSKNLTKSGYSHTSENSEIPRLLGTFVEFIFFRRESRLLRRRVLLLYLHLSAVWSLPLNDRTHVNGGIVSTFCPPANSSDETAVVLLCCLSRLSCTCMFFWLELLRAFPEPYKTWLTLVLPGTFHLMKCTFCLSAWPNIGYPLMGISKPSP